MNVSISVGVRLCIEMNFFLLIFFVGSFAIAFSIPFFTASVSLCVYAYFMFTTLPRSLLFHLSFSNFIQLPSPSHSNDDDDDDHFVTRN